MKLDIKTILEAERVLESKAFDTNIKGRYALKLLKNLENLKKEVDRFDKLREPILIKYCDKDNENNPIITNNSYTFTNEDNRKAMLKDMNELLIGELEVDIEIINIDAIENIDISVAELSQIKFMLDMEE